MMVEFSTIIKYKIMIEIIKATIEILKFYYIDIVVIFLIFIIGIGVGMSIKEILEKVNII